MSRIEPRTLTKTVFSLCIGLCVLAAASIASAQTPAAMEVFNDTATAMQERAARIDFSGADMEKGTWREDIPQDGTCVDSAFTKSLGDPQAWACFGQDYNLETPSFWATAGGPGYGRGIGFQADSDFKLNAVSIMGELIKQEFEVVIYTSTDGHTAGSVLATFSATVGGTGNGWNTVPVAFDFEEGDFYVVNWRPLTPSTTWVNSLDYYNDSGLPATIGPLTVLEGYEGTDASPSNPLHPYFKFLTGADCYCEDNDLTTPDYVGNSGGAEGGGRAIGFRADRDFRLNAVSIKATLIEQSFDVVIYESTDGHTAGSVLATYSATTGGTGFDWNVVPVSYKFKNGNYYVVNWRPTSPVNWADTVEYYNDSGLPFSTGPVTIVEGYAGADPSAGNAFHPHLSFCISGESTVAILAGDYKNFARDVREKLIDTGVFAQVDMFFVSDETPTLAELQAYAAVLVWSNSSGYSDAVALGDNLADYVDSGGGVVTAVFANASIPFSGRFDTDNYWAIAPSSQTGGAAFLGAIWAPGHPILEGVSTFGGGSSSYRPATTSIQSGATRVADWTDGTPLVATKRYGTARRVDLGFFPPSSDIRSDFWDSGTDGARLMANALKWVTTCSDCDIENFSDPLAQWQNDWLFLNSNIENYYVSSGGSNCDPGYRGNQPEGIWFSDDPGCSNFVVNSPVRINLFNGYGDEANSFTLDHFTCVSGITFNVYDKDGVLVASDPLAADCWNWSHYSVNLSNGISAFEYASTGNQVEGNSSVDNVQLRFSLFRDGFESIDVSEWSAVRP